VHPILLLLQHVLLMLQPILRIMQPVLLNNLRHILLVPQPFLLLLLHILLIVQFMLLPPQPIELLLQANLFSSWILWQSNLSRLGYLSLTVHYK
jgi:hypothetical protein